VLDVRKVLEAHPTYSGWLDWTPARGSHMPRFQEHISKSLQGNSCFVPTGEQRGRCLEYQYCPELALAGGVSKAGSTKSQRGYTDMGRRSTNKN
jgi:hypothetical protein